MTNNISSVTRAEELEASLCGLALRGALPHTIIIEGADVSVRREIMRAAARALVWHRRRKERGREALRRVRELQNVRKCGVCRRR